MPIAIIITCKVQPTARVSNRIPVINTTQIQIGSLLEIIAMIVSYIIAFCIKISRCACIDCIRKRL